MDKLEFSAPKDSLAYAELLKFATSHGADDGALRQLLWLMNAHPELVSHARILQNLSAILASPIFSRDCVTPWAGSWTEMITKWIECSKLLSHNKAAISRHPQLRDFDLKSRSDTQHPLQNRGLVRHAIPGTLWTVTELLSHYPPPVWDNSASVAYFRLQAHFFAAVVESRHRLSSLEFYEQYCGDRERPIAPTVNSAISPSIRELSFARHAPLLELFPLADSTIDYARQFDPERFDLDFLSQPYRSEAKKLVAPIARFFHRFLKVLHGWRPSQYSRFGATYLNRTGSNGRRPGFIPSSEVEGIYRRENPPLADIPSPAKTAGATLFVNRDPDNKDDPVSLEKSGLAPEETLEEVFTLLPPDAARNELLRLHRQNLAITSRAQSLPFDNSALTDQEIRKVWRVTSEAITTCLNSKTPDNSVVTEAQAAVAIQLSLCFGQPLETVLTLRILKQSFLDDLNFQVAPENHLPAMIIKDEQRDCITGNAVAIALPAIHPEYQSELSEDLEEIDRPYQAYFTLPDLMGCCELAVRLNHKHCPSKTELFPTEQIPQIQSAAKNLIRACHTPRISLPRVQSVLARLVTAFEGDVCLSWVITADPKAVNQPRLFYTRYRIDRLHRAFSRASRRIARAAGHGIPLRRLQECDSVTTELSVGARFVISRDALHELIKFLKEALTHPTTDITTLQGMVEYANLYVLYSSIFQSLDSSLRAINSPSQVYSGWYQQSDREEKLLSVNDKSSDASEKARLATVSPWLSEHFFHLYDHQATIGSLAGFALDYDSPRIAQAGPFFFLTEAYELKPVTAGWLADQLYQFSGFQIPANFHRAFLRTELLERDCPAELVDAFLGHANAGENPLNALSTFDYEQYRKTISQYLQDIQRDIGLEPIPSQFVTAWSK